MGRPLVTHKDESREGSFIRERAVVLADPLREHLETHLVGNRVLNLVANALYNTTLHDMETGYKAFRAGVLRALQLHGDDFGVDAEITAKVCLLGLRVYGLPIAYYGRTYADGKELTWRDASARSACS